MASEKPIHEQDLVDALTICSEVLRGEGLAYAVIGGMAASFHAGARFTKDVDFLLRIPQLAVPHVLEALAERGFEFELIPTIREWTQHHMVSLTYRGIPVDWLKPNLPVYEHALERASEVNWFERKIRVASVEGLILTKLIASRLQDQLDISNLIAIHRDKLDLDWIRSEWQTVAPLDDPRMIRFNELLGQAR